MSKTIVGLFDDFTEAQTVVQDLVNSGIPREDISIAANQTSTGYTGTEKFDDSTASPTANAVGRDATKGAVVGGIGGLLVGLGFLAVPGVGPLLAAGPLLATLTGAGVGAVAGGLIGALTHAGVPEEDARYYAEGVRRGGTLVTVNSPDDRAEQVVDLFNNHNAVDIDRRRDHYTQTGYTGYTPEAPAYTHEDITRERDTYRNMPNQDNVTIPVVEEELQVGKRQVQRGGARIHTVVSERPVEEAITLREEHVTVDRHPVNRPVSDADLANMNDRTIEVTETNEEAVVNKQARVVEEVTVNKSATERTETVRDTVRRTDVNVEELDEDDTLAHERTTVGNLNDI